MSFARGLSPQRVTPELDVLVKLFHPSLDALGTFREVQPAELPDVPRNLLWHDHHMTIALEDHYRCEMEVHVVRSLVAETHYARDSILKCECSDRVVQYGICRLNLMFLPQPARTQLLGEFNPLGRVLIDNDVLRQVRLLSLWSIAPGELLRQLLQLGDAATCYGRTALIYCNTVPAVELLEIISAR